MIYMSFFVLVLYLGLFFTTIYIYFNLIKSFYKEDYPSKEKLRSDWLQANIIASFMGVFTGGLYFASLGRNHLDLIWILFIWEAIHGFIISWVPIKYIIRAFSISIIGNQEFST